MNKIILDYITDLGIKDVTSDVEAVNHILMKEYGKIIPMLSEITSVEVKEVDVDLIDCHDHILEEVLKQDLRKYEKIDYPIICIEKGNKYWLIDGYHRIARHMKNNQLNILTIILK